MKLLIVGSRKQWAIENYYYKYLDKLGVHTDFFPIHDLFYDYYYKNIFNKLRFKVSPSSIYRKLNDSLLMHIESNQYDIIWIFKGMEVFPKTLKKIKMKGIKLVNFNPDHPFYFSGKGSGNKQVLDSIPLYDLHLSYHPEVIQKIEKEYKINCEYLPFGYEPSKVNLPEKEEERLRACFIGNPDKRRIEYLNSLVEDHIPLDIYGNQWDKYIRKSDNVRIFPAIYGDEFNKVAPLYRAQINIFRDHNIGAQNMRTFEMPGLGCLLITPFSTDQQRFFKEGKEVFYYRDKSDLAFKIKEILDLDYNQAITVRNSAFSKSEHNGYDYRSLSIRIADKLKILVH